MDKMFAWRYSASLRLIVCLFFLTNPSLADGRNLPHALSN